jgi:hypothetical protein
VRTEFIYHTYYQLSNTSLYNLRGCVSWELVSKAYYEVKSVVWTPFWPSGTAKKIKHLARIVRLYSSCAEATLNVLYREDLYLVVARGEINKEACRCI